MSNRRYRTKDTVGKIGADAFRSWAGAAGLVVNESGDDQAGWDFLVESNPAADDEPTPDPFRHADTFPVRARVQVKATDKTDGLLDVKLSNWVRMVETPDPAFFFVAELDGHGAPQRAWLYHVGPDDWRRVQERKWANEVGRGGKARRPLHKLSLRLRYADGDPLPELSGGAVLDTVARHTGSSASEYGLRKAEAVRAVGFEEGNVRLHIQIESDAPDVLFAEAQLRLRPSVPVKRARVAPARFGIEHEGHARVAEDLQAFVTSSPHSVPVEVAVAAPDGTVRIDAQLQAPDAVAHRLAAGRDLDGLSVRVESSVLDLVGRFGPPSTVTVRSPQPDQRVPVRRHRDLIALTRAMAAHARGEAPLDLRVSVAGNPLFTFGQGTDDGQSYDLDRFPPDWVLDAADAAWSLARAYDAEDLLEISLEEAVSLDVAVGQALGLADGTASGALRFEWSPSPDQEVQVLTDVSRDVVLASRFTLGSLVFSVAAHLDGALHRTSGDHHEVVFESTSHSAVAVSRLAEPPPDLEALALTSLHRLGRKALIQILTEDQTAFYSPSSDEGS